MLTGGCMKKIATMGFCPRNASGAGARAGAHEGARKEQADD